MITDIVIRMDALAAKGFRIGGTFSSVIVSCFDNAFDREKAALIMKYVQDKNAGRRWSSPGNSPIRMVWDWVTIIHEGKGFKLSGTDWIYSDAITSLFYELHECCVYYYENKGWEKYMYPGARDALSDWITSGIRVTVVAGEFPVDYAARVLENNEFSPDIETDDVATTFRPLSISSKEIDYHAKIRKIDTTLYVVTEMHEAKGLYGCGRAVVTLDRSGYLEKKCFWSGYGIQITSLSDIEIGEPINAYLQSEAHQ